MKIFKNYDIVEYDAVYKVNFDVLKESDLGEVIGADEEHFVVKYYNGICRRYIQNTGQVKLRAFGRVCLARGNK